MKKYLIFALLLIVFSGLSFAEEADKFLSELDSIPSVADDDVMAIQDVSEADALNKVTISALKDVFGSATSSDTLKANDEIILGADGLEATPLLQINSSDSTGSGTINFGDGVDDDVGGIIYDHVLDRFIFRANGDTALTLDKDGLESTYKLTDSLWVIMNDDSLAIFHDGTNPRLYSNQGEVRSNTGYKTISGNTQSIIKGKVFAYSTSTADTIFKGSDFVSGENVNFNILASGNIDTDGTFNADAVKTVSGNVTSVLDGTVNAYSTTDSDTLFKGYNTAGEAEKVVFFVLSDGDVWADGAVRIPSLAGGSVLNIQGWATDIEFFTNSYNSFHWTSGTITLGDGTTFNINQGGVFNIENITYVYFDKDVSETALQDTTAASAAVGARRILIAVVGNVEVGKHAEYIVFGASSDVGVKKLVTADVIVAETITGNEIAANTITTNNLKAGSVTTEILAANAVQVTNLNFVPLFSTGDTTQIVATINATSEGIRINAGKINITGSTTFEPGWDADSDVDSLFDSKVDSLAGRYRSANTGKRVEIFPDANTGIRVTNGTLNVFEALVGGADSLDVTIGDYDNDNGLKWDHSASTFMARGNFETSSGSGQRMILSGADNNLKFYDSDNNNVLTIDDNIYGSTPGISIADTVDGASIKLQRVSTENRILLVCSGTSNEAYIQILTGTTYPNNMAFEIHDTTVGTIASIKNNGNLFTKGNITTNGTVDGIDISDLGTLAYQDSDAVSIPTISVGNINLGGSTISTDSGDLTISPYGNVLIGSGKLVDGISISAHAGNVTTKHLPSQSGQSGKYLSTNGTIASWAAGGAIEAHGATHGTGQSDSVSLGASQITSGILPVERGGSGVNSTTFTDEHIIVFDKTPQPYVFKDSGKTIDAFADTSHNHNGDALGTLASLSVGNINLGGSTISTDSGDLTISPYGNVLIGSGKLVDGYDISTLGAKLAGIATGADVTANNPPQAHNQSASTITTGTLAIARGGTYNTSFTDAEFLRFESAYGNIRSSGYSASSFVGSSTYATHIANVTTIHLPSQSGASGKYLYTDGSVASWATGGSMSASEILTALKTVDGAGSGLDADLLDGKTSGDFALIANGVTGGNSHNHDGGDGASIPFTSITGDATFIGVDNINLDGSTISTDSGDLTISPYGNVAIGSGKLVDGYDISVMGATLSGIDTAAEILALIKTVDGTGSGLDADLLDGSHAAAFALASHNQAASTITTGLLARARGGIEVDISGLSDGLLHLTTAPPGASAKTLSTFGATLIDDADAATARTTLGIGSGLSGTYSWTEYGGVRYNYTFTNGSLTARVPQ